MLRRPEDLFDRTTEWDSLAELATSEQPGMLLGIVSGRRRHGKSFLLRRIVTATGGLYHQALEVGRSQALQAFADDVARSRSLPAGTLRFDDWETAFRIALGLPTNGSRSAGRDPREVLVIDELPYLLGHSPEIPSILQLLYDECNQQPAARRTTVVLCGSALSVMLDLLSGAKPLRGRARLDMRMRAFDFRMAADFWHIEDPGVAFRVDAILGGTPGYKALVSSPPPSRQQDLPKWVQAQLMSPSRALYSEKDYLLREDPRISDKAVYNSILSAVARGAHKATDIGGAVARDLNQLRYPLSVLEEAGFLNRVEDQLTGRRPLYFLADPIVRFAETIVEPFRYLLEEGEAGAAWSTAQPAIASNILGPHFEHLTRVWTSRFAGDRWGEPLGSVGPAVISDAQNRSKHEIDVVGLARGHKPGKKDARIVVLGEAKATSKKRTQSDLARLEEIRAELAKRKYEAQSAHLVLFSREGFDVNLEKQASTRDDVHLVDLAALYER